MTIESEKNGPWGGLSAEALEQARREREQEAEKQKRAFQEKVLPGLAAQLGVDPESFKPVEESELPEDVRKGFSGEIPEGAEVHMFQVDMDKLGGAAPLAKTLAQVVLEKKAQIMVANMCETIEKERDLYQRASERITEAYNELNPPIGVAFAILSDMVSQLIIAKDNPKLSASKSDIAVRTLAFVTMLRRAIEFDLAGGECNCPDCVARREAENEKSPAAE